MFWTRKIRKIFIPSAVCKSEATLPVNKQNVGIEILNVNITQNGGRASRRALRHGIYALRSSHGSSQRVFKIVSFGMPGVSRFGVRNVCDDGKSEMM